ncbi:MAG: hypothetical protein ABI675_17080 [Chitinophagaceae bacterium]
MKESPFFTSKILLLSVIFYFLVLEIVWVTIDWQEFQIESIQTSNFFVTFTTSFIQHWQYELMTFVYKIIAFLILVGSVNSLISDHKKETENLLNTLLSDPAK